MGKKRDCSLRNWNREFWLSHSWYREINKKDCHPIILIPCSTSHSHINSNKNKSIIKNMITTRFDSSLQPQSSFGCDQCDNDTDFVEDFNSGDLVCRRCGLICQERVVDTSKPEYRTFTDDTTSQQRKHIGESLNSYFSTDLTTDNQEDRFLQDAYHDIYELLTKLYRGHTPKRVRTRAEYFFMLVYKHQQKEKETQQRRKFSRRKQFVVTAIYQALREANVYTWSIYDLSERLCGIDISQKSVVRCLNELISLLKTQQEK